MKLRHLLAIVFVSLLALHKTLRFYFWHDDFTVLYWGRLGDCTINWPYTSYCFVFEQLYKVFGQNPIWYFGLGAALAILSALTFYILLKEVLSRDAALWTTLLFSTFYVGAGSFLESYDSIFTSTSLALFFVSVVFCIKAFKGSLQGLSVFFALLFLAISTLFFPARSASYIIPFIAVPFLFSKDVKLKSKVLFTVVSSALFLVYFLVIPGQSGELGGSLDILTILRDILSFDKVKYFFQTLGSFVILNQSKEGKSELISGIIICVIFVGILIYGFKNKELTKVRLFAGILVGALYLPFAFRSEWFLHATHRYISFVVPGFLVFWATLHKAKLWKFMSLVLIVMLLWMSNQFFDDHLKVSNKRKEFYRQLHQSVPTLVSNPIFYFHTPQKYSSELADFMRVGGLASEAALASEFGVPLYEIEIIPDSHLFQQKIISNSIAASRLYVFYYDGTNLLDMTKESREDIKEGFDISEFTINKATTPEFVKSSDSLWTAKANTLSFDIPSFIPVLPFRLAIKMQAKLAENTPLPYTQGCIDCNYDSTELLESLNFLTQSRMLKNKLVITASHSGEGTLAENLNDGNPNTYWVANRQEWFKNNFPVLNFKLEMPILLDGFILVTQNGQRSPSKFEVYSNDKLIEHTSSSEGFLTKLDFNLSGVVQNVSVKVLDTVGGDVPVIDRIEVIPFGFDTLNLLLAEKIRTAPAAKIDTKSNLNTLDNYLSSGVLGCLEWTAGEDKGHSEFTLYADGKLHEYMLEVPLVSQEAPQFSIGCLNVPLNLEVVSVRLLL